MVPARQVAGDGSSGCRWWSRGGEEANPDGRGHANRDDGHRDREESLELDATMRPAGALAFIPERVMRASDSSGHSRASSAPAVAHDRSRRHGADHRPHHRADMVPLTSLTMGPELLELPWKRRQSRRFGPRTRTRAVANPPDASKASSATTSQRMPGVGATGMATVEVGGPVGTGGSTGTPPPPPPLVGGGVTTARVVGGRGRGRRSEREGRQLADDGARLDAAVLVLVAGSVELERAHVPRRAGHLAGAVALAARGHVPEARLGEVAAPREEHGRAGRHEANRELGGAVAAGRARVGRPADRRDRAAPDRQSADDPGIGLRVADRQAVGPEPVGREGAVVRRRHRRAHRRDAAAAAVADRRGYPAVPAGQEVVRLVAPGGEVVLDPDRVRAGA